MPTTRGCGPWSTSHRCLSASTVRPNVMPMPWLGAAARCWRQSPNSSDPRTSSSIASSSSAHNQAKERTPVPVRVVIAEDEAIIRLDLRETLQEQGYDVVGETGRGDEAVELVREHRPDLAILDIKMPGMDGLSAAREIAGEGSAAVLILTAFSQRDLIEQARDAGVLSYLVKPFQRTELIPAIEIALGRFAEKK